MPDQVLIYSRFPKVLMMRISERYDLLESGGKSPADVFTIRQLQDIRALITAGGQPLGPAIMDSLPKLGAIICYGTGYDGVDLKAASARGIAVGHSPAANAAAVADLAMTLMLAAARRLLQADAYVRSGDWAAAKPSPTMTSPIGLTGRRAGIYGMGEIGRKLVTRLAAFEMDVGYFSRSAHDVAAMRLPSLAALAEWSDVLFVAVRAGAETQQAIDSDILGKLGANGLLINIARGSVIDEAALVAALAGQVIAGAALDVYETEPHKPGTLSALPNVVLTPHIGGHTAQSHQAMQDCVLANLDAFFQGSRLAYPVV